jgi:hypothetical protein
MNLLIYETLNLPDDFYVKVYDILFPVRKNICFRIFNNNEKIESVKEYFRSENFKKNIIIINYFLNFNNDFQTTHVE